MKKKYLRLAIVLSCLGSLSVHSAIEEEIFDMELQDLETEAKTYELESGLKHICQEFLDLEFKSVEEDLF